MNENSYGSMQKISSIKHIISLMSKNLIFIDDKSDKMLQKSGRMGKKSGRT
jgi:hypothetical protein